MSGVETASVQLENVESKEQQATDKPQTWSPEKGPHLIELSITASHVGEISTTEETCNARLWVDVYWLPSEEELQKPEDGPREWRPEGMFQLVNKSSEIKNEVVRGPSLKDVKGVYDNRIFRRSVTHLTSMPSKSFTMV